MIIESKENKKIKNLIKLRNSKYMREEKKFIVEGDHLINEAYHSGVLLETFSLEDTNLDVPNNLVSKQIMEYISNLPSKSNIIGICKFIEEKIDLGNKVIILDDVRDPGNVGTIIRSAKAFNIDTIVLSLNSVNKYNEKLIRAAQGMLFKMNVIVRDVKYLIPYLKENGYSVYGTDVTNGYNINDIKVPEKIAIVMGNEGVGITDVVKKELDQNIYINMEDSCESLNVSVAASIIMYELYKGE